MLVPLGLFARRRLRAVASCAPTAGWPGSCVEAVAALLLVWRRRHHAARLHGRRLRADERCRGSVPALDDAATPILVIAVICYSLGRWISDLRGLVGIGVSSLASSATTRSSTPATTTSPTWSSCWRCRCPPYLFGRITRRLAVQSELLARQQELIRDEAVRAERDRIARELHDVIAHSLSAMVVQTAAAQDLRAHATPTGAERMLATVAATGRSALDETGRLLHVLRDDADELGLRPAPGLRDLAALVEGFRAGGLAVDAAARPAATACPPPVDTCRRTGWCRRR